MFKMKNNRSGFTLIEVVVTIALIAIVIPIIYNFISFGGNIFSKGTVKAENQNDVNLIAYKITNQLRTVGEISLNDKTGYTLYDIKSKYPTLDLVSYTLSKKSDTYMLNFTIEEGGHRVTSEIALNNVKTAIVGSTTDQLWVLNSESVSIKPQMSLGSASELFRKGDPTKVINFPVVTSNMPNNAILAVSLTGIPTGVEVLPSPLVVNNKATIGIRVYSNADVGVYPFTVTYPGADDISGELHVLDQVDIYTVTFIKNGGLTEATPSAVTVQSGLSIGTSMPEAPTYPGYTFTGWNIESNGSSKPFDENSPVSSNLTVFAQWISNTPTDFDIVNSVKSNLSLILEGKNGKYTISLPSESLNATLVWKYSISNAIDSANNNILYLYDPVNKDSNVYTSIIEVEITKGVAHEKVKFTINLKRNAEGSKGVDINIIKE